MKKSILLIVHTIICFHYLHGQLNIAGFVRDSISGERLIGANVVEISSLQGAITNNQGYFSLNVSAPAKLKVSFVGYQSRHISLPTAKDTVIEIYLNPGAALDEAVIKSHMKPQFHTSTLSQKELQYVPSIGAKPDVLKTVQLLPGIQSQNEGSSVLLVRGGDPGENLYLFDGVPIIYVNHLGGFTSVFNPDMINDIDVYKGGFPAKYGGKLSSVVDITQKEGNQTHRKGSFGIGLTDASFSMEGPLGFKNSSYIITARKTLIDPLMALTTAILPDNPVLTYGFHDINAKLSFNPNINNSFHLNLYQGDDYLNIWAKNTDYQAKEKSHFVNIWGNWLVSADWKHVINPQLYISNSLSFTRYRLKEDHVYTFQVDEEKTEFNQEYMSAVQNTSFQSDWKWNISTFYHLNGGAQVSYLYHMPNRWYQSDRVEQLPTEKMQALQSAFYLDNTFSLSSRFSFQPGARAVFYQTKGFSNLEFEPRLSLNIGLSENHSLNINYMHVNQYSHLIFTTGSIMNNEIWVPVDNEISPSLAKQAAVSWKGQFFKDILETEVALYYKKMSNLVTYKEGYTSLMGDGNWRAKLEGNGEGMAKGFEFFIRKGTGKWTGFAAYTWSNATRQFPGINNGEKFVFDYDRPHALSISVGRKINDKLRFNLSWIYQTGLPYTPAIGRHYTPDLEPATEYDEHGPYDVLIYGERNSQRMRDYHRLDIGLYYTKYTKRRNRKAEWSFSVYNAYNRQNPYYYYFNSNSSGEIYNPRSFDKFKPMDLYQISFFPIIPTISYKVYFDKTRDKPKSPNNNFKNWLFHEND